MQIHLSDHFNYKKLLRFTLSSMLMMVFTSIYSVVDGFFVSNYTGKTAFAAVNFIMPVLIIFSAAGFMFSAGGSALVGKILGEQNREKANSLFSFFIYVTAITGVVLAVIGVAILRPLAILLGGEGEMLDGAVLYGRIILIALPMFMLQIAFQTFFITAEKPHLGLVATLISGCTNMLLDWLFVGVFSWGLVGAAVATAASQTVGGVLPLFYFFSKNPSLLRLGKCKFDGKALLKACTNGSSEMMANVAMAFLGMLYNIQLLKYAGENGVAAYGVLMYVGMIFNAIFIGYATGSAPIVSYHFGAKNKAELQNVLKRSIIIIGLFSFVMFASSELLSVPFSKLFVGYDEELLALTKKAFIVFSVSYLFMGYAIYFSSFFTALNDGLTSALISFLRTLVFQLIAVLLFPIIFGVDGIWWSVVVAELSAALFSFIFLIIKRKKYGY